jgi:phospholipid/cholesterol/gamma-HCH transport system substrate-binding protein
MENKAHALAAGIFVAVLTAMVLGLAAWLTRDTGVRDTYEISTRETVTGLQEQAPVRYRGVDVGKVSSVGFDPKAAGNVLVRLQIDREAPITRDTYATLSYQGVTGLAFIQLADDGKQAVRLEPNEDNPPRIPLRPGLLAKLEAKGEVLIDRVDEVAQRVNRLLNDDNQKKLSLALDKVGRAAEEIGQAADGATKLTRRLDNTVATRLDPALAEATVTMRNVQKNADQIGETAADFGRTAKRLNAADGPIDRLAEGTEALSHAADSFNNSTLPRINRVTEDASRAVRALGRAANGITDNPQSLISGGGAPRPGPGEPGFQAPGGAR